MPMSTITVGSINPGLNVLGAIQQLNYTHPLSALQITNSFIPSILIPSQFNHEFRNNLFSGFRWSHITTSTDTFGSFTLQSFVNAQTTGSDIMKFNSSGIDIFTALNLNSQPGISGQVLTSQGAGNTPIWTTNGSGSITSITAGAGLSATPSNPITTSGTIVITDTGVSAGTYNGPYTVNSRGQLTAANNRITGVPASLFIVGSNDATPIHAPNTPTKILGISHPGSLDGFTAPDNNKLTYEGSVTITPMVTVDVSVIPTVSSTLAIMIYKNGVTAVPGANYNYQLTGGKHTSLTLRVPVQFLTNDYIEVFIMSDSIDDTPGVIVSDMNLLVVI